MKGIYMLLSRFCDRNKKHENKEVRKVRGKIIRKVIELAFKSKLDITDLNMLKEERAIIDAMNSMNVILGKKTGEYYTNTDGKVKTIINYCEYLKNIIHNRPISLLIMTGDDCGEIPIIKQYFDIDAQASLLVDKLSYHLYVNKIGTRLAGYEFNTKRQDIVDIIKTGLVLQDHVHFDMNGAYTKRLHKALQFMQSRTFMLTLMCIKNPSGALASRVAMNPSSYVMHEDGKLPPINGYEQVSYTVYPSKRGNCNMISYIMKKKNLILGVKNENNIQQRQLNG